jgi:hypothetical protein
MFISTRKETDLKKHPNPEFRTNKVGNLDRMFKKERPDGYSGHHCWINSKNSKIVLQRGAP